MVALKNPHKRSVTFTVTHPEAAKTATPFLQPVHNKHTGELSSRKVTLNLPDTVTVLAGETREDLPDYVLADALRAGLLEIEAAPPPQPAEGEESAPEPQNALKRKKAGT